MTKLFKSSIGCPAFLLLFNAMIFISQSSVVFVSAQNKKGIRGFRSNRVSINGLPHRELQNEKNNKNNKDKNKNTNENEKNKENKKRDIGNGVGNGVAKIETTEQDNEHGNVIAKIETAEPDKEQAETDPLFLVNPSLLEDELTTRTSSETPEQASENNDLSEIMYDKSKFVTATKLQPITFKINVEQYSAVTNVIALTSYIKIFIDDILDMKSNVDWYPTYPKTVDNLSIDLVQDAVDIEGPPSPNSDDRAISVRLVINGVVFVHAKPPEKEATTAMSRSAGEFQQDTITVDDSVFRSTFSHSMLLYFTFWGIDGLQKVLEDDGGLRKPVISSVVVGEKELVAFGTDKDDIFAHNGDQDSSKPKRSQAKESSVVGRSGASFVRASTYGLLTFVLISATSLLL